MKYSRSLSPVLSPSDDFDKSRFIIHQHKNSAKSFGKGDLLNVSKKSNRNHDVKK